MKPFAIVVPAATSVSGFTCAGTLEFAARSSSYAEQQSPIRPVSPCSMKTTKSIPNASIAVAWRKWSTSAPDTEIRIGRTGYDRGWRS